MPTIKYPNNPNVETAFVEQDDGTKNRVVLTAPQDISTIEYPNNPNSTKAYVTVNGKKQRVVMTADIAGGGSSLPDQTGHSGEFLTTDGTDASWSDKPLVNRSTSTSILVTNSNWNGITGTNNAICIDNQAPLSFPADSVVIGRNTTNNASHGGRGDTIIGYKAHGGGSSIAIGKEANASNSSIQIGKGTNSEMGTFCVSLWNDSAQVRANYKLLDPDGTVPTARLTKVNSTITLTAAGWSSNTQTVSVTGMTATGVVLVSPDPTGQADYTSAGIICSAQAAGTLTFTCSTTPANDIDVVVVML